MMAIVPVFSRASKTEIRSLLEFEATGFGSKAQSSSMLYTWLDKPDSIAWGTAQSLVNSAEVVMHEMKCNHVAVVLNPLAKALR